MKKTFKGGVHPEECKDITADKPIESLQPSPVVIIPLSQHTGTPAKPVVKIGDQVKVGTKIAEADGFVSVPMHSSVSGKVKAIEELPHPLGRRIPAIAIENDGKDEWIDLSEWKDLSDSAPDEIRNAVREAGIVGLGGAAFPTHVKLSPPKEKPIEIVILNGAECEPYLTGDHRLMLERTDDIIQGLRLIMKVLGAKRAFVGIERNKPDAIQAFSRALANEKSIEVVDLKVKYPQGAEKQLIKAITGREVPCGGLPMDVGCLVQNVGTSVAIYEAVRYGKPLVERVVTVTGCVAKLGNYNVRIGTIFKDIIDACGGATCEVGKIVMGGPMMGIAQASDEVPVVKGTSGILLLAKEDVKEDESRPCLRCGTCVDHCPMRLVPNEIVRFVEKGMIEKAEEYGILDCMECGVCAYVCPSKIRHVHLMKVGKAQIFARRKKK